MSETKYVMIDGKETWMRKASPDDPIYKRGFVFGGMILKKTPKNDTPAENLKEEKEKQED